MLLLENLKKILLKQVQFIEISRLFIRSIFLFIYHTVVFVYVLTRLILRHFAHCWSGCDLNQARRKLTGKNRLFF